MVMSVEAVSEVDPSAVVIVLEAEWSLLVIDIMTNAVNGESTSYSGPQPYRCSTRLDGCDLEQRKGEFGWTCVYLKSCMFESWPVLACM